mgnify:CR=1 FL=1
MYNLTLIIFFLMVIAKTAEYLSTYSSLKFYHDLERNPLVRFLSDKFQISSFASHSIVFMAAVLTIIVCYLIVYISDSTIFQWIFFVTGSLASFYSFLITISNFQRKPFIGAVFLEKVYFKIYPETRN